MLDPRLGTFHFLLILTTALQMVCDHMICLKPEDHMLSINDRDVISGLSADFGFLFLFFSLLLEEG